MRIRTIKPEFWLHEGLCQCSEFARLMAIALLNWSDDEGYFMAHPALLRGSLFPFLDDSKRIPGALQDLSRVGWIILGKDSQGRPVGKVLNFSKHQRVDKPQSSKIKGCSTFQDDSGSIPGIIQEPSKGEWKGMEGEQGKERKGEARAPTPASASLHEWLFFAATFTPPYPPSEAEKSWNHYESNGWRVGKNPARNWQACCRKCYLSWKSESLAPNGNGNTHHRPTHRPAAIVTRNTCPLPDDRPDLDATAWKPAPRVPDAERSNP